MGIGGNLFMLSARLDPLAVDPIEGRTDELITPVGVTEAVTLSRLPSCKFY